ncbi:MAG TPA: VOC family protein [Ohtaekwangia sp.]|nr:VOC family protein [Ohtaekwangia sp.]
MNIIPIVKCREIHESVSFYTRVLDFTHRGTWPLSGNPAFTILIRDSGELHLSSHSGDGICGNRFAIIVNDIDGLFNKFISRGLDTRKKESPVHQGPLDQSWGTREFYVDDPDGNIIRFIQR